MPLRNQPYLPLYVQDFLTDEKLMECSASATGIYIRLLCIMHKSDQYGKILLKQKDKQTDQQIKNFALKLAKHLPYNLNEIEAGLSELITENVLKIDEDSLVQKRMVKDNNISEVRSEAAKKGAKRFAKAKPKAKGRAKATAKPEYEIENENGIDNTLIFSKCVEYWLKEFHKGWIFNEVQGKHLKEIIQKLIKVQGDAGKELTETAIIDLFKSMCQRLPDWYRDKDLQIVNSKFNEIIEQIKNGTNGAKTHLASVSNELAARIQAGKL